MNIQLLLSANQGQGVASPLQLPAAGSPPLAAPMFLQVFTQATNHQSLAKADTQVDAQTDSMPTAPLSTSAEQLSSLDFELVEEVPQNGNAQWQSAPPIPNMQDSHAEHGTPATPLPSAAGTFASVQAPSSEQVSSPLASSHAKQAPGITIEEVASRLTLIASYSAAPVAQSHTAPSAQSSHSATLINQHASTSKATADSQPSVESDVFSASLARTLPMPLSAPDSAPDRSMAAMATPAAQTQTQAQAQAQAPKPNAQLAAQRPSGALSTTASTTDSLPVAPASSMVDSAAMSQESANKAQPIASSNVAERAVDTTSLPTNTAHTQPLVLPTASTLSLEAASATASTLAPTRQLQTAAAQPTAPVQPGAQPSTQPTDQVSLPVEPAATLSPQSMADQPVANATANLPAPATSAPSLVTAAVQPDTQPETLEHSPVEQPASALSLQTMMDRPEAKGTANSPAPAPSASSLETVAVQTQPAQPVTQSDTLPTAQVRLPVADGAANLPAPAPSAPASSLEAVAVQTQPAQLAATAQPDTQPTTQVRLPVEPAPSLQTMADLPVANEAANQPAPALSPQTMVGLPAESGAANLSAAVVQPQPAQPTAPTQPGTQPDTQPVTQARLPVEPAPTLSPQTMADLPAESGAANLSVPSAPSLETVAVQPQPAQPTAPAQSDAQPDTQPVTQVRLPVEPAPALSSQTMADLPVADGSANLPAPVQSAPAPSLETLEAVAVQPQPAQPTAPAQSDAQPDAQPTTQVRLPVEPASALSPQTMADLPVADGAANLSAPVQSAPAPSLETLEAVAVQPQPTQPTAPAQPDAQPDAQPTTQVRLPVEPAPALNSQTMADLSVVDGAADLPAPAPSAPAPSLETVAVQPQPTQPTAPAQPDAQPDAQPTTQVRLPVEPAPALNSQTMAGLSVADGAANLPAPAPSAPAPSLETVAVQPQPNQPTALAQPGAQPDTQATTQVRLPVEPAPTLSINAQVMNELLAKEKAASTNYLASRSGELAFPSSPTLQRQVIPTVQASSSTGSFSAATLPLPTIFPYTQPLVLPTASSLPLEALATPANELAPTAPLETTATQPLATTQPMAQPRLTVEAALVPAGNTEAMASPLTEETVATQNKHAASQNSGVVAPVSLSPQQPALPNSPATISLGTPVTSPSWPSQLGQQLVQFTQRGGEHQIKMQLHPAELGPLSISLKVSEQGTQAHFLTASAQARQVIELAIPQLREALAEQGISLGETSVGEQGTSGEQLFAQQESGTSRNLGSNDDREGDATATLDMSDSGSLVLDGRIDLYA
ncbi:MULTISPECIES: flagellar hook-length control protein FliK [unclassified Halomonas]|uniref:flagellar hook-length control protein FliK n=1 Tax=unclassified Halomonas TaxID=2609666 RepID=UPI0009907325|nr:MULTISPECIES: flagellar hook-length control protein FliK [unclassified Halomonas]AQU84586.1 hypothetical protein B2G49_19540 [Halomonas sp. 'Soap Lake \